MATPRAVSEPLDNGVDALRLVDVREARRVLVGPFRQAVPATAHTRLAEPRGDIGRCRCVEGGVIGFANDVLHQVIHAVHQVNVRV